jgi:hypothetical protein
MTKAFAAHFKDGKVLLPSTIYLVTAQRSLR